MAPTLLSGRYELGDRLGSGGMSNVYKATDRILERTVAVKVLAEHLSDDERFVARFRREALAVAKLIHPNIVQVYDTGVDDERHFIVMEYVEGRSGAQILQRENHLDPANHGRDRGPVVRRARLRAPPRDHPPRRQARQPDDHRRPGRQRPRDERQAHRLRDRAGRRADPHNPGRLGGRDRRLPGPRAGARRGGDARLRRLRARRRPLPVPDRAPALRGGLARRACGPPAERAAAGAPHLQRGGTGDALLRRPAIAGRRSGAALRHRPPARRRPAARPRRHRRDAGDGRDGGDRARSSASRGRADGARAAPRPAAPAPRPRSAAAGGGRPAPAFALPPLHARDRGTDRAAADRRRGGGRRDRRDQQVDGREAARHRRRHDQQARPTS